jgi:hypothetical protein
MATVDSMTLRPQELLKRMGPDIYRDAYRKGMSVSAWLEREDPSAEYKDNLDAFGRLLKVADIRTTSMPELGVYASTFDEFERDANILALAPEFLSRAWRRAATGKDVNTRAIYESSDTAAGGSMFPYAYASELRAKRIAPAIPLAELVAITTPITSGAYQAFYLTESVDDQRMKRIAEGTDVPVSKLTGSDHTIRLKKYGRGLEASYEVLRRQRLDMIALHMARLAVQAEVDKVSAAIDILVSGDGASGAATNYNLTTLDSGASAGTMTLKGWLAYKMKFANPYILTHILVQEAVALQLMVLNTGSANIPLVQVNAVSGFGGFSPINPGLGDNVRLGWTADAPSLKVVGLDNRFALEQVTEIGANIEEVERFVQRQTQAIYLTEVMGFCVFDPNAVATLDVNA